MLILILEAFMVIIPFFLMEGIVKFFALKQSAKDINPLTLSHFGCEN